MNNERYNTREVPTDFPWKLIEDITNGFALEQKKLVVVDMGWFTRYG